MESLVSIYLIVGIVAAVYFAVTEDDFVLDGTLSSTFMLLFMICFGPLFLLWTGMQSLLESSPKPLPPSKPKKTDDELVEDFKNSLEVLKELFSAEITSVDIKITKGHIAQAQKLGALSRKMVVKPYLDKVLVTQILNKALAQIDTVYVGDSSTAVTRKTAIKEHLNKINGTKRTKKPQQSTKPKDTSKPKTSSKKKNSDTGAKNKGSKKDTIGFNLSDMANKDNKGKSSEKSGSVEGKPKDTEKKKKLSVSINYD
ncbi:hypothetical protein N9121_01350 [Pseudomonadales bacterium]|jgi:hypothetical protein|nr:hypothetical protein [Pseudomonadales bacterium]MDB4631627.1 hypothetical protein [Pseudomonadales bacterium]|tara:strand:+ start:1566 stop:2333 length:768 start_codon:yes stop_codon:yes gene_type:complete